MPQHPKTITARKLAGQVGQPRPSKPEAEPWDWRDDELAVAIRALETLTPWERKFGVSLRGNRISSQNQREVLRKIAEKARRHAA